MKRVLFVDDEQPMLDGLRTRLHRMNGKWQMTFVDSGERALAELDTSHYDVIVTDMRMPGMDGAQLLQSTSERSPDTIRIVLSGYAEAQQTSRLVPIAHQYLSKPCESPMLENVVDRCVQLHELLRSPGLRASVGRITALPAMPITYAKLQQRLAEEDVTVQDIARIVSADTAIAARVLQIVNSAFFRLARRITNIEQAVTYLGFAAVRNLVMCAEVFSQWKESGARRSVRLDAMQTHALRVATATLALTNRTPLADDAMLAGLVHDIGYWILAQECPDDLAEALDLAREKQIPMDEAERQVIGSSHAQIGAYLLGLWGMPYGVIEAVAFHHSPRRVAQTHFDILAALAVAHTLTDPTEADAFGGNLVEEQVDAGYLDGLEPPFDWDEASRRVRESLEAGDE
jgi:HD-like signal output (HDOD) protein/AmiR/NasT family two-component response regulator